jgi:hypothetical protein
MADSDDASTARLNSIQYVVQQIGGGRRQSPTPVLETPTRLRPRWRPTYADSDDVCKTLGIRSKPKTTGQGSLADTLSQRDHSGEAMQTVTSTCPPTSLHALPSDPCTSDLSVRSSTSRQSSLVPTELPVRSSTSFREGKSRMVQRQQQNMGEPSEREHYSLYCWLYLQGSA